jgi:DNA-binding transcriptional MerR regulator
MARQIVVETWLSSSQAAYRAQVRTRTIREWAKTKPLVRERDTLGRWWYLQSSLDAITDARKAS